MLPERSGMPRDPGRFRVFKRVTVQHVATTKMPGPVDTKEYLRQSNAIENVHTEDALDDALAAWDYLSDQDELSHDVIKRVHDILLQNRQPDIAGDYRDVRVRIGGDVPPHQEAVPSLLSELLDENVDTGVDAVQWHVTFEKIHPFRDGNGRVGRLLYLWHCRSHLDIEPIVWRADSVAGYYDLFRSEPHPTVSE